MENVCIVGAGHVGVVTGACLAELGHQVVCVDSDSPRIQGLERGIIPFYEPGVEEMVHRNANQGKLTFTTSLERAVEASRIVFICVGTPPRPNGEPDLSQVEEVSRGIASVMDAYKVILEKSTVPVKTGAWIRHTVELYRSLHRDFDVVCNPEFMSEGTAIRDFMTPNRIVIGSHNPRAAEMVADLYKPINAPILITDIESAELIKYASNSFLALKISFINAIAELCERVGADVTQVAEGMGLDRRIGASFLGAGVGYGGSCLPKDLATLIRIAEEVGYDFQLLREVHRINEAQKQQIAKKAKKALWNLHGKTVGVLGLAFKPGTDDVREAPALDIIRSLRQEGAWVRAYDPKAMNNPRAHQEGVEFYGDPYELARDADALIVATEWQEFRELDLPRIKQLLHTPVIIDGRNIYDPEQMRALGFLYYGVGR